MSYPHQSGRSCAPLARNLDANLGSARPTDARMACAVWRWYVSE